MLETVIQFVTKTAIIVGLFGLLILVHEWGHFIVARMTGVRVLRFSIGFGPKIFSWKSGETDFWVSWVPLGGYVKMSGEQADKGEAEQQPYDFAAKPVGVRTLIVLAGPAVNYVSAILFLWIFFMGNHIGILPYVGDVVEGMPAATAGFEVGDRVVAINGEKIRTWDDMTTRIHASPGEPVVIDVARKNAEPFRVTVTPVSETIEGISGDPQTVGLIGVGAGEPGLSAWGSVREAVNMTTYWSALTFKMIGRLFIGRENVEKNVTGPIGIVYLTSRAVDMGWGPVLMLLSLFSLSLAIFNVLPIPVLDGGHLLFLLIEKIKGSALSPAAQEKAVMVGMTALLAFALFISAHDIKRYFFNSGDPLLEEVAAE